MKFEKVNEGIYSVVAEAGEGLLISDAQSALDIMATARYDYGDVALIFNKADITEDFFELRTGIAGEVLQKFVNYRLRVAIVGDYSGYTSKALRDFIYESNNGSSVFFVEDGAAAVAKLSQ